jgi:hypothetical protein
MPDVQESQYKRIFVIDVDAKQELAMPTVQMLGIRLARHSWVPVAHMNPAPSWTSGTVTVHYGPSGQAYFYPEGRRLPLPFNSRAQAGLFPLVLLVIALVPQAILRAHGTRVVFASALPAIEWYPPAHTPAGASELCSMWPQTSCSVRCPGSP